MRRMVALLVAASMTAVVGTAWAYWSGSSLLGGNGAAAASSMNQGATPTTSVSGAAVTVSWSPTTLTSGQAVSGYTVVRYAGSTAQTIQTACTGTIAATSCTENGVPTGSWTYTVTPVFANNWVGTESAKSSAAVVAGSAAPVAVADNYSVNEDTSLNVTASGVLGNDTDAQGDPLTSILASGVANGALTFNANGSFGYTPNPHFNGSDSFTYNANDGVRDSNTVTVTIGVTAVNDAPVNSVPGPQQTPKNTNKVFSTGNNSLVSISDVDAGGSTVQVTLTATSGTVTLPVLTGLTFTTGDGTADATMTFTGPSATINSRLDGATFIPTNNFTGAATLQVVTSDLGNTGSGGTLTDTDSVTINVNALGIFTANQDIGGPSIAGSSAYSAGTYTMTGSGADIWANPDQFQYASVPMTGDGRLTARVVTDTNPHAAAKAGVMMRNSLTSGSVHALMSMTAANGTEFLARSVDGASPYSSSTGGLSAPYWVRLTRVGNTFKAERSPDGTTWTQQGTTQTVAMGSTIYVGLVTMSHTNAALHTATFDNVAITTPPTAVGGTYSTNEDTTLNVVASGVLGNDTDPEGDNLTAVLVSGTTGLTLNANGSFAYVPPANFSGAASFTYKANDGVFDSNTVTVNLTVYPANEVPGFTKGADRTDQATDGARSIAGWATAITQGTGESGQLVDFIVTNTDNSLFSTQPAISPTGTLTYTIAGGVGSATVSVRIHDNGGTANGGTDTSAIQTFTITVNSDAQGPTGGSVDASGLVGTGSRYSTSTTLSLVLAKGSDPNGVAATGATLKRATATLTSGGTANGACGTFGGYTLISGGTDPVSPKTDTVTDQACYSYQYAVADTLGNPTTYTSPDIKVDLTAPAAPMLAHTLFTNTWWPGSGTTVYYRSAAASGSFTATGTATDAVSGIASYAFPALGTNWTSTPGALGVITYSWSGAPQAPGTKSVTATNHAAVVSGNTSFTPTADDTAPTSGSVSYTGGDTTSTSVSVSLVAGTDAESGIGTRLLQRSSATLTGSTCGAFGAFATVTGGTNPGTPHVDTVANGACHQYQYLVADHVGNVATYTNAAIVKVAAAPNYAATVSATIGLHSYWRLGDAVASTVMDDITTTNNNGTFFNAPTRGVAGAMPGDSDTAVQFNGSTQYATATRQLGGNFSLELWVKSTQNYANNPACTTWVHGAGLIDAIVAGNGNDFGISMCSGKIIAGVGSPEVSVVSASTYNDGNWHHVVFTRTQTSGAIALYVDGSPVGTATGSTSALTSATNLNFGRSNSSQYYFAGTLDEAALYTSVLTQSQVTAHYSAAQ